MPVKLRLQRHGKKGKPFYWIVAADARSKRDGKYLEKVGTYNPTANPAVIELDIDGAVKWLQNGAQPTDTVKAILSYKGALLKKHLVEGVKKGALTEEQAEAKFQAWLQEKEDAVQAKKDGLVKSASDQKKAAFKAEKEANEKRVAAIAEKNAPVVEEVVEEVTEEVAEEPAVEDTTSEEPAAE
ncbi:MAG: 30S ribosomal protein S16 [Flavobacteriaceae bacterium]|nr:30S ribosomal protein S16 [Flavobacteriaceae bacterium]